MDENSYPLSQWQDTVRYLTGDERDFASVKEIKAVSYTHLDVYKRQTQKIEDTIVKALELYRKRQRSLER